MTDLSPWIRAHVTAGRPWQRRHLDRALRYRRRMWLGARQDVGKTWQQAGLAVALAAGVDWRGVVIPGHDVYLVSADQQRSVDMIRRVQEHLDAASVAYDPRDPKLGSTTRIALRSGAHIRALTGEPSTLQGLTGSVVIDELSRVDQPEELFAQALSVTRARPYFRASITSNAGAGDSWLAEFWTAAHMAPRRAAWDLDVTTVHDVYTTLPNDLEEVRAALSDEHWRRYFLCEFAGADDPILTAEQRNAAGADDVHWLSRGAERRWLSVDVGAGGDATAVLHLATYPGGRVQVESVTLWHIRDTMDQAARIAALASSVGAAVVDIDAAGVGRGIADALRAMGCPVRDLQTTDRSRAKGAEVLRSLAGRGLIAWGRAAGDVSSLRRDLSAADVRASDDGGVKGVTLPRRRNPDGTQTHCDALDALLQTLATHADSLGGGSGVLRVGAWRSRRRI